MAFLESLAAAAASKAGAVLAGTALTVSGVGVAAATDNLPEGVQERVENLLGSERGRPDDLEVVEVEQELEEDAEEEEVEEERGADAAEDEKGSEVSRRVAEVDPELTGRDRGVAVSTAARTANGSLGKGQGFERRAEAHERAAARAEERGAEDADEPAEDAGQADERKAEAQQRKDAAAAKAAAGRANADEAPEADDVDAPADETETGDDAGRQDAAHRPEGVGGGRNG